MAATSTLKQIMAEVLRRTGLGAEFVVTATTTAITGTNNDLAGPFVPSRFPIGAPIRVTANGLTTDNTYVSAYAPSTGIITCSPAITTGATSVAVAYTLEFDHMDRVVEAINRVLANRCARWTKVPLTFVPDGAFLGTVASFWTASAGTVSYVSTAVPEVFGGRCVQISHSSTATATSNTIPVRASDSWEFETAIRAASDGDTATLVAYDITNSADITVTYQRGSGTTTSRSYIGQRGTFTVPATCDRIAFKLTVTGSGTMTAQMAPITAYPRNATSFPLANRVQSDQFVGNFYYPENYGSPTGPDRKTYHGPLTRGGLTHTLSNDGDHMVVTFNFLPPGPVAYAEYVREPELSAVEDTTTFPLDYVTDWAAYELKKYIAERKRTTEWKQERQEALRTALSTAGVYESDAITVLGRV